MSANTTLLLILTIEVSLLIICGLALVAILIRLVQSIRRVVDKAEDVIDTAETVADTFKDAKGGLSVLKLLFSIVKTVQRKTNGKKK